MTNNTLMNRAKKIAVSAAAVAMAVGTIGTAWVGSPVQSNAAVAAPQLATRSVSNTSHSFTVQATNMTVRAGSAVYLRNNPWNGAGSKQIGMISQGQTVKIIGIVMKGGRVADWYKVNVNGRIGYASRSYMHPQVINGQKNTNTNKNNTVKKTVGTKTVCGVTNYLGIRTNMTQDYRYEIGQAYNGDRVKVHSYNGQYAYVTCNGTTGYVLARFLK